MKNFYSVAWLIQTLFGLVTLLTNCQTDSTNMVNQNRTPMPETVTASITSPMNGQSFSQDQEISFIGSAALGSSEQITGDHLMWISDKDGIIGLGNSFNRSGLSVGNHTITLTATASSGEEGMSTIQLVNQQAANRATVLIESPSGTHIKPSDIMELRGSATAPDGSPVTDPLAFEWRSNVEIDPGPFLGDAPHIAPAGLIPGLHTIALSVLIPDGNGGTIAGSASIELFVEFGNGSITFDILNPANGSQLVQGEDLVCTGSGNISGGGSFKEIIWISSIDGVIGIGEVCVVAYLTLGTHRITVIGTASDGRKGTASTIIEVVQ